MALIVLAKTLLIFLGAALVLGWLAAKLLRASLLGLIVFIAALAAGGAQSKKELDAWVEESLGSLSQRPGEDAAFRHIAETVIPFMRKVGAELPPRAEELLRDTAKKGSPCHRALARKALGEDSDPVSACK